MVAAYTAPTKPASATVPMLQLIQAFPVDEWMAITCFMTIRMMTTRHNNDCTELQLNHCFHEHALLENVHMSSARTRPCKRVPRSVRSYRDSARMAIMMADPNIKLGAAVACAYVAPAGGRENPL